VRILVASVTNKPVEILQPHLASVLAQELPSRVKMDLAYIVDGVTPEAEALLVEAGARVAEALPKPSDATYNVTEETHEWSEPSFGWLAREKQRLLDLAVEDRYDGIFFVDSDLVLGPETLASLVLSHKDVTSAVFWTRWTREAPPLPQVWQRHPYEFDGRGLRADEFLRRLDERSLMRVGGLGACTLIRSGVFSRVRWFPLVDGLPRGGMWQGEDRHFCVHAAREHVELWADAWPDIHHLYRPTDIDRISEWKAILPARPTKPARGDVVSLVLETVEEPGLKDHREHIRGVLGSLPVLGEIEDAVFSLERGEDRIVRVEFPAWWSVSEYRGKTKHVLLRLLDIKRPRDPSDAAEVE
jgi:hypothetical protein